MSDFLNSHAVAVQGLGFGHKAIALQGFRVGISITIVAGKPSVYIPTKAGRMLVPEYYMVTIRVWFQGEMVENMFRVKRNIMERVICTEVFQRFFDIKVEAVMSMRENEKITVKAELL